jgi:hypothetical protein
VWVQVGERGRERRRVIDLDNVDRDTLKSRLASEIDSEWLARGHSHASIVRESSIIVLYCMVVNSR